MNHIRSIDKRKFPSVLPEIFLGSQTISWKCSDRDFPVFFRFCYQNFKRISFNPLLPFFFVRKRKICLRLSDIRFSRNLHTAFYSYLVKLSKRGRAQSVWSSEKLHRISAISGCWFWILYHRSVIINSH